MLQISAYIDTILGSLLPAGSVTALMNAQTLYTLPVSLFGMSVSAAELPVMSSAQGDRDAIAAYLRTRLDAGLRRIAFFVVPSAMAFVALGDVLAAALFQTGRFTGADATYVWSILAGSAVGLARLDHGPALRLDVLRPARHPHAAALRRRARHAGVPRSGFCAALVLPRALGIDPRWGAAGLAAASGIAGWTEFLLLRRTLRHRIGRTGLAPSHLARLWIAAAAAAAAGLAVKLGLGVTQPILRAGLAIGAFGAVYLLVTWAIGVNDSHTLVRRLMRRAS